MINIFDMKNYSNLYKILAGTVLVAGSLIIACNKELDKTDPSHPTLETYFKNSAELLSGTNAIYSIFHSGSLVGREWFFVHDLRGDDVASGGGQLEVPRAQILNGATTTDNALVDDVWNGLYTVIHRANTVIDNGPNVTDNDELRDRCVGEALFFRGWAYFELVSMWGAVPVYTTQVTEPSQFQARKSEDSVYLQVIQDLTAAAAVLPATTADLGRATKGAAQAMLGRAYMQMGDYAAAKTALEAVISSGQYRLMDNYSHNFDEEHEFNAESIFEAVFFDRGDNNFNWGYTGDDQPNAQPQSTVRNQEYSPIAWRNLIPSNRYLNEFENTATGAAKTDPRFAMSVYQTGDTYNNNMDTLTAAAQNGNSSVVNGVTKKISWRKFMLIYKDNNTFRPGGINQRIIRYAEVLLMMAECEAELGSAPAVVTGYLNQVRNRPGVQMPPYPTAQYPCSNKAELIRAIMHEKTVELGGEEIRNRDILRWRKQGYFTTDPLPYFRANRDELLPVPQAEIDNNPELGAAGIARQNVGY
ncbi:putative outer membrane starch-binding protein [Chitinophaga japonensis]|uniref:Putative outer membrane starch-binding protein n=2 Tax=Chitinophaga japonensis TaxID=104662 RepID=A0A562T4I3_CHIJA|nr:putative outer membrane starch-binding protein [Chitinophaga japonensis]